MKKYIGILVLILLFTLVAVIGLSALQKKDLRDAIATAVNVDSGSFVLNIPPKPFRFPGSILSPKSHGFLLYNQGSLTNGDLVYGDKFSIEALLNDSSMVKGLNSSAILNGVIESKQDLEISLSITDAQIVELPVPKLKDLAINDTTTLNALANGLDVVVVNRSYQGVISYSVKAKDDTGVEALVEISDMGYEIAGNRGAEFEFVDKIDSKKEVIFSIKEPIIFAYELMSMKTVTTELSNDPGDITLTPISNRRAEQISQKAGSNLDQDQSKNWGLVTISSAHFLHDKSLNTIQAATGAELINTLFSEYGPSYSNNLHSTFDKPLTDEDLLSWSIDLTMDLIENPVEHLVVYYTGHGLSLPNGELLLLQGNVQKDFAEKSLKEMDPQIPTENDGLIRAQTLYAALDMSGVPFTLIIDACYPSAEMQQALNYVHMEMGSRDGTDLLYFGDQTLITDEMSEIGQVLVDIGRRFPYRLGSNAIIFSSKPGAYSEYLSNPIDPYGYDLPPLAARMLRMSEFSLTEENDANLLQLVRPVIDNIGGVGELSLSGSMTWSDIDPMSNELAEIFRITQ